MAGHLLEFVLRRVAPVLAAVAASGRWRSERERESDEQCGPHIPHARSPDSPERGLGNARNSSN